MFIKKDCFMRNPFPEEKSDIMFLFTVQAIIQCYSPTDITDKGIMGCQMDKGQSKNGERKGK